MRRHLCLQPFAPAATQPSADSQLPGVGFCEKSAVCEAEGQGGGVVVRNGNMLVSLEPELCVAERTFRWEHHA